MTDINEMPESASGSRPHVLDLSCWCGPKLWVRPTGGSLIVHNGLPVTPDEDERGVQG